jgi:hypothetical protein
VNIGAIVKRAQKATADNAPTILTALGVTGLITTAVLTGKASFKAGKIIHERNESTKNSLGDLSHEINMTSREMADITWKLYIPAAATGAVTIACIVSANHISTRRTAALASAYSITQEAFREYREKIVEKVGEKKEQQARDEIAQESVSKNPPPATLILSDDKVLCKDMHTGRYFQSTLEDIKKAINDTNYQILNNDYASLSDFWDRIGLEKTSESDEIGWNTDCKLEVVFSSALTEKNQPCITIDFRTIPVRGYWSLH